MLYRNHLQPRQEWADQATPRATQPNGHRPFANPIKSSVPMGWSPRDLIDSLPLQHLRMSVNLLRLHWAAPQL
ncbi:hypothetical protein CDV36_010085 [Fusarium kuroshium]|uniref:Uncharacterized protein n=1 Tax=Fusarium kuroshium TaxID=2010991 RepID=A0A3M2RYF5_9HYPO|nr:hypothetical protein CDV36_010085 [Fusarium kuroshium]